jgi:hypothetical protein
LKLLKTSQCWLVGKIFVVSVFFQQFSRDELKKKMKIMEENRKFHFG